MTKNINVVAYGNTPPYSQVVTSGVPRSFVQTVVINVSIIC